MRQKKRAGTARAASKRYQHYLRDTKQIRERSKEECLVIFDGPNINTIWNINHPDEEEVKVPYRKIKEKCSRMLYSLYSDKYLRVQAALFINVREQTNMFYQYLSEESDWTVFRRPKIEEDDDIDENICQFIDFYLEETPVLHVVFVGNDLRNYLPIMRRLQNENIGVTLVSFFNGFKHYTIESLQDQFVVKDLEKMLR